MSAALRARPRRDPVPALPAFEKLDRVHAAALNMLQGFERLLQHLDEEGPDETARAAAREIIDFFSGPGRDHHADEETQVFPGLLASGDAQLVAHVRRLQQDHGWIEEDWRELGPQVEAIARGDNWYDMDMLRVALPIFSELYHEHIALEESLVYPAARRQHEALQKGQAERTGGG